MTMKWDVPVVASRARTLVIRKFLTCCRAQRLGPAHCHALCGTIATGQSA